MARSAINLRVSAPGKGVDGRSILTGQRPPTLQDGRVGDCWIDLIGKRLYGPRSALGWPDSGLIKGDRGWVPVLALRTDGARRICQIVGWQGGEGEPPSAGHFVGAAGPVALISDAMDVRGPEGPTMQIAALAAGGDDLSYNSMVAAAEAGGDNRRQPLKRYFSPAGEMTFPTIPAAAGTAIEARVQSARVLSADDDVGGDYQICCRVDSEPAHPAKFQSLDRYTASGGTTTDSANGGWWEVRSVAASMPSYPTADSLGNFFIPARAKMVMLRGYHTEGKGAARWRRLSGPSADGESIKSADFFTDSGAHDPVNGGYWGLAEDLPSLYQRGAYGDAGVHDDTPAFLRAFKNNRNTLISEGNYVTTATIERSGLNGCHIITCGVNAHTVTKKNNGDFLRVTGIAQRHSVSAISLFADEGMTTGWGFNYAGGGNPEIADSEIWQFPGPGLDVCGTINGASGVKVLRNGFLSNGVKEGTGQFRLTDVGDYTSDGNQMGAKDFGGPYPPFGTDFLRAGAGSYTNNLHWENLVGARFRECHYLRRGGNRYETNQREGLIMIGCVKGGGVNEQVHTNSMEASGVYDGVVKDGCILVTESSPHWFTWNNAISMRSNLRHTDCIDLEFSAPMFGGYAETPVATDGTSTNVRFTGVLPAGLGIDDGLTVMIPFHTDTHTGGSVVYGGPGGASTDAGQEAKYTFIMAEPRIIVGLLMRTAAQPGAGESYTVQMRKNYAVVSVADGGINDGFAGASPGYQRIWPLHIACAEGDEVSMQFALSPGAATSSFRGTLICKG